MYWAAQWGAEVIGIDVSAAVDRAFANTAHLERAHVVQGDIFRLPLVRSTFDFAYSLGVLHHLPDTGQGLASLARHVRPGGTVITWLYAGGRGKWFERVEPLRRRVARLPLPMLYWLCFGIAALAYPFAIVPYRWLARVGLGRRLLERFPAHFRYYAAYPFRVYHADWVDRLSAPVRTYYQPAEARELLVRNGLAAVETYRTYETGVTAVGHVPPAEVGA
jgi:SAM-dependent methyltransferase